MSLNHNEHFRLETLADEIRACRATSVLDVGGAKGQLSKFIPEVSYTLADPNENGIYGESLPFSDESFDYVVSCHTLEHVPLSRRRAFLDEMLSKSQRGVILLNPFYSPHTEERLRFILEITDNQWAKEHLTCSMPVLEDITKYAEEKGLHITIRPNGSSATTLACVFLDYFAKQSGRRAEWNKVNEFFNRTFKDIVTSDVNPNAYLVRFDKQTHDHP